MIVDCDTRITRTLSQRRKTRLIPIVQEMRFQQWCPFSLVSVETFKLDDDDDDGGGNDDDDDDDDHLCALM